jgi:hypothetical protein
MATEKRRRLEDAELLRKYVETFGTWDDMIAFEWDPPHQELVVAPGPGSAADDFVRWQPLPWTTPVAAVEELEAMLPHSLPPLYRELILGYRFLQVDLDRYDLLANPPSDGLGGLSKEIFRDKGLSEVLLENGFIQFGRGSGSSYDPVCFDTSMRLPNGEPAVVRLDHEQILCYGRIKVVERLAPSFRELNEDTIDQHERSIAVRPRQADYRIGDDNDR